MTTTKKKSRLGPGKDNIFKPTETEKKNIAYVIDALIRPAPGTSVDNKQTVILTPDQVNFLDRLALDIKTKTGAKMKRTEIIRALIVGLMESGMDLTGYPKGEDIAVAIRDRLKG